MSKLKHEPIDSYQSPFYKDLIALATKHKIDKHFKSTPEIIARTAITGVNTVFILPDDIKFDKNTVWVKNK